MSYSTQAMRVTSAVDESAAVSPLQQTLYVKRLPVKIESDDRRVIVRPFILSADRVHSLFQRINHLSELEVDQTLAHVRTLYASRHDDLLATFTENYESGVALTGHAENWDLSRRLLAGAYLTMEYAIDSAALFNPSIVALPAQSGIEQGALRVVLSLRATGEGHVSSIVFHTGVIRGSGEVLLDPPPRQLTRARIALPRAYDKPAFQDRLRQMHVDDAIAGEILQSLSDPFDLPALHHAAHEARSRHSDQADHVRTANAIERIASTNYRIQLDADDQLNELVIFPLGPEESRGIEDLRLVRFVDNGNVTYFGTYTAYDGYRITPMMLSTTDFRTFEVFSIGGPSAKNKGMSLFPRKIDDHFVMCSRIDGENLFIVRSKSLYHWPDSEKLVMPQMPWELFQLGNCGSPIETREGWLLLTHGVGPMRSYSIGAMLLDLENPLKVIGHLKEPLIVPDEEEREGYVPNVVYTCGMIEHNGNLIIPYAQADKSTGVTVFSLDDLLARLRS